MCLTVPCRVLAVNGAVATVERGEERIDVSLMLTQDEISAGDWVAVQAQAYVHRRLDADEAAEILQLYKDLAESADPGSWLQ